MVGEALRSVLVAGGGLTAWCAAAALKRRAPFLDVTLLATAPSAHALADRISCTLPSLLGFHGDLKLGDDDAVTRTGSGYRLGTLFEGWSASGASYVHAYGRYGRAFGATSFHLHWVRAAHEGAVEPFDGYAPAAALARAGRFTPAQDGVGTSFADHEYGLTLNLPRYAAMIRAFGLHVGVREVSSEIVDVRIDGRGSIEAVELSGDHSLQADLYVDATGPEARLRSAIDTGREDWSRWLPCDRLLLAERDAVDPPVLTPVTAMPAGWRWTAGAQSGLAYSSAHLSDGGAERALRNHAGTPPGEPIRLSPGTRPKPWRGNCIAIGDAATQVEPLEWCNLHLALSAIDRLLAMLPGREVTPVEAADFNRQARAEADRVRDFLAAHYRTAGRDDSMWRDVAAAEPPASLAHTLSLFEERGRLPFYEEETFARDSWCAMLLGQQLVPRRIDPLVDAVPSDQARAAMSGLARQIAAAVPNIPTHSAYRAEKVRRLAR